MVNWLYLDSVLQKCGIQDPPLQAILGLYSTPSAKVLISGMMCTPFPITNGTWQGYPLSPLIFALVIEPLAQAIRSHPDIVGLSIDQTSHKICLYANDIIIWLMNPLKSLPPLCDLLQRCRVSMYRLNHSNSAMLGVSLSLWLKTAITTTSLFYWAPTHPWTT